MAKKYYRAKELLIAAAAYVSKGDHAKAGKCLLKASEEQDFGQMLEDMDQEQAEAQQLQQQQQLMPPQQQQSALDQIIAGMDDVNDIDDMLEDFEDIPADEEVAIDAPPASGDVDVDVEDEEGPEEDGPAENDNVLSAVQARMKRAQTNLKKLGALSNPKLLKPKK